MKLITILYLALIILQKSVYFERNRKHPFFVVLSFMGILKFNFALLLSGAGTTNHIITFREYEIISHEGKCTEFE